MTRVRVWPGYGELAPIALASVDELLAAAKTQCNLDIMGTATTITAAKKGGMMQGDLTLIIEGLPRATVIDCVTKIAAAKSMLEMTVDNNLFHANVAERALASGAILPNGEVVIVSRQGNGIAPAAWKTEVETGGLAPPTWWADLQGPEPVIVRSADDLRVVVASATLDAGIAIKGVVTNKTAEGGNTDAKLLSAMLDYLEKGQAGTGKVVANGASTNVELTASGTALTTLIKMGGAALFPRGANLAVKASSGPFTCDQLADAVQAYMQEAITSSAEDRRQDNAQMVARVLPDLQRAYVNACTTAAWQSDVIACHIDNAKNLPRFERCRMMLPDEPRATFDAAVGAVLSKEVPAPPAAGSGSAS